MKELLVSVLICNNVHDYPIVDPTYKKQIMKKGRIDLEDFTFDIEYDEHVYIDLVKGEDKDQDEECYKQFKQTKSKIVLCELHDLCRLANKVMEDTHDMITHTDFNGVTLRAYMRPGTGQIIISAEDYKQRKKVCEELNKLFPCETFKFKNQSWTQLASDYFGIKYCHIPESGYGIDYLQILENYNIAPYTSIVDPNYNGEIKMF